MISFAKEVILQICYLKGVLGGSFAKGAQQIEDLSWRSHLDLVSGLEAVKLVEQLQHGTLHLRVATAATAVTPGTANAVHLVHEDDAGRMLPEQTTMPLGITIIRSLRQRTLSALLAQPMLSSSSAKMMLHACCQ